MVKLTEKLVLARTRASDLENVKKINCWGNELTDVTVFKQMPNVEVISLSVNSIATLEHFSHCQNLCELYIRKNAIGNLYELCHLRKLPKLQVLWLADNPCATQNPSYRLTVLRALPNLQKLDNIVVLPEEVNKAIEEGEELSLPRHSPSNSVQTISTPALKTTRLQDDAVSLSLDETNKIREQLGLRPLPADKLTPQKIVKSGSAVKKRNANILSSVLILIKELDYDSIQEVIKECENIQNSF